MIYYNMIIYNTFIGIFMVPSQPFFYCICISFRSALLLLQGINAACTGLRVQWTLCHASRKLATARHETCCPSRFPGPVVVSGVRVTAA